MAMTPYDSMIKYRARESLGQRVKRRRKELQLTQIELAEAADLNQGYLSEIERDRRVPSARTLSVLAAALDLPEAVLVGEGPEHDNPQPLEVQHLPIFATIPGGSPVQSQDQAQLFPVLRHMWSPDHYCLRLAFDSMEPTLKPGDIILVRYRPNVDPELVQGKICACLVDGEPTLKRVFVDAANSRKGRVMILRGDNPTQKPLVVDSRHDFSIQGVAVCLVSRDL